MSRYNSSSPPSNDFFARWAQTDGEQSTKKSQNPRVLTIWLAQKIHAYCCAYLEKGERQLRLPRGRARLHGGVVQDLRHLDAQLPHLVDDLERRRTAESDIKT